MTHYTLRQLTAADRAVVTPILVREWGAAKVMALSLGEPVGASALPGWLAERDGEARNTSRKSPNWAWTTSPSATNSN